MIIKLDDLDLKEMFSRSTGEPYTKYSLVSEVIGFTNLHISFEVLDINKRMSKPHYHTRKEEVFVILSGTVTVNENGVETIVGEGNCISFSPQKSAFHYIVNQSDSIAKILVVSSKDELDKVIYEESTDANKG